jgi:hypothetical protein
MHDYVFYLFIYCKYTFFLFCFYSSYGDKDKWHYSDTEVISAGDIAAVVRLNEKGDNLDFLI